MAGLMDGKRVMVFGVANERSIAWGISQAMHAQGAKLGFNYVGEKLERRVRPLAEQVDAELIVPCDVTSDDEVTAAFEAVKETWGGLDVLVHSVAFANREDLDGRFSDTSRAGFLQAMEISAYSLVHLAREAAPLMDEGGSIVSMTYYGAEKVVENYNVMGVAKAALEASTRYLAADLGPDGIRVNAISAGPIKTLAASGVRGFRNILSVVEERAPLRRNVTQGDVGQTAVYLCSDLAAGVTGEVIHVDSGYSILGY
ncbi:MAG TPA: enoyl-ACP reductase FabI [Longimicrobiales bacterium]|nr:enoyl-ACP reductase FabI [Longimicrobiales bacterium]